MAAEADDEPFSSQENDAIATLLNLASSIDQSHNTKKMATPSPLAQAKKYIATGSHVTTGYFTTLVRSNLQGLIKFINEEDTRSELFDQHNEKHNNHHSIKYYAMACPNPVSDREWHVSIMTKTLNSKTILKVCVPCFIEEKLKDVHPDRVRAEIRSMYKLTKISNTTTRVEFYAEIEFGGIAPRHLINRRLPMYMSGPTKWQEHFQHLRMLRELTSEDGVAMGTMLTLVKNNNSVVTRLTTFISMNVALKVSERSERALRKTRIQTRIRATTTNPFAPSSLGAEIEGELPTSRDDDAGHSQKQNRARGKEKASSR